MVRRTLLIILLAGATAWGQRSVSLVDPKADDPELVFDVNEFPVDRNFSPIQGIVDLNFSPRVVFTQDSQRAFVSFPGSDKVAVFAVPSGEMLDVITVRTNPSQLSLTPDGRKLAVPCVFLLENLPGGENFEGARIGSISIIDVETLEVQNLDLEETIFSLGNNIVFSADSRTGFVASAGTDEILRFDVETATEIGSRIAVEPATRPLSITMGPDFSFFGVVLVGSTAVDNIEIPDSIQIVDTETFTISRSLSYDVDLQVERPYDFLAENNVAFSPDGKLAFIGEQANSRASVALPELIADRALLIDMESGELLGTFNLGGGLSGGQAGSAYATPDGRFFIILSALDVNILNIETQTMLSIQPFRSEFRPTSRIAISADSSRMYVASPVNDFLETIRIRTGEVFRGTFMGGVVQRTVNGMEFDFLSAPLDTALSPDQKTISTVNFNADTVQLFQPSFAFYVPELVADNVEEEEEDMEGEEEPQEPDKFFTGFAINNVLEEPVDLVLTGINSVGQVLTDVEEEGEEGEEPVIVQDYANPTSLTLQPRQQFNQTTNGLLQPDPLVNLNGWLDVDNDGNALAGIFLSFDDQVRRLDGGQISDSTLQLAVLPEAQVTDGFVTELVFVNPNLSGTSSLIITLLDREGNVLAQSQQAVFAGARFSLFVRDPDPEDTVVEGIFDEPVFDEFEGGYLAIFTTNGLLAYERYYDRDRMAVLNAISLQDVSSTAARLFAPHAVLFEGADTIVNLINFSAEEEGGNGTAEPSGEGGGEEDPGTPALVTLTLRNDSGEAIAGPATLEIFRQHSLRRSLADIFELEDTGQTVSGWLDIESDTLGIVGNVEIQAFSGQALTAVPLQTPTFLKSVFPHVAQGLGFVSGMALLNPGQLAANLELELRRQDGSLIQMVNRTLEPGQRLIGLLPEIFPELAEDVLGGSITVSSDQPLVNLELFFTENAQVLSAVPSKGLVAASQE